MEGAGTYLTRLFDVSMSHGFTLAYLLAGGQHAQIQGKVILFHNVV